MGRLWWVSAGRGEGGVHLQEARAGADEKCRRARASGRRGLGMAGKWGSGGGDGGRSVKTAEAIHGTF